MKMSEIKTTVLYLNQGGHTALELTRDETIELAENTSGTHWTYAGNQIVQPAELAETDWGTVGTVRIAPAFIAGQ
tara:strand:+ start:349 stop:573 length:225 start_codon:yes stop_codon:yes gene_type:complete